MVQCLLRAANHRPLFRRRLPRRHHRQWPHHRFHCFPGSRLRLVWPYSARLPRHHTRRSPSPLSCDSGNKRSPSLLGRSTLRRRRTQRRPLPHRRRSFRGQQSLRPLSRSSAQSHHRRKSRRLPEALHPAPRIHTAFMVAALPLRSLLPFLHQHPRRSLRAHQTPPPRRSPNPFLNSSAESGFRHFLSDPNFSVTSVLKFTFLLHSEPKYLLDGNIPLRKISTPRRLRISSDQFTRPRSLNPKKYRGAARSPNGGSESHNFLADRLARPHVSRTRG